MRAATPFSSSVRLLFLRNCFAQLPLSLLGGGVAAEYHMERGHFDDAEQHCKALLDRGAAQAKERAKALLCAPRPISFSLKTRSVFLLGGLTVL